MDLLLMNYETWPMRRRSLAPTTPIGVAPSSTPLSTPTTMMVQTSYLIVSMDSAGTSSLFLLLFSPFSFLMTLIAVQAQDLVLQQQQHHHMKPAALILVIQSKVSSPSPSSLF